MLSMIVYYLISASAVLFYGIGLNKSISHSASFSSSVLACIKALFSASATTSVTHLLMSWLLVPCNLSELFPFVATLLFILFTSLIEIFVGIGIRESPAEFSIPLLAVFLGLNEGIGIAQAVVISCMSILSFYVMVILFYCVRQRVSFYTNEVGIKTYCILLLCLALIMMAICGVNISWFNLYLGGGAN